MKDEVELELRNNFLTEAENILALIRQRVFKSDSAINYFLLRVGHMRVLGLITLGEASAIKQRINQAIISR